MTDIKDNQVIGPDGDLLTFQNPKFEEAEVLWPDGSVLPIYNAKIQLSEDNLQRYLTWHAKEVRRMLDVMLRVANHRLQDEADTHKQLTLVYDKASGMAWLRGNQSDQEFKGRYSQVSEALKDCIERGFEPEAYFLVN